MSITYPRRAFLRIAGYAGAAAATGAVLAACGGGEATPTQVASTGETVAFELNTPEADAGFDQTKLEAPAGAKITIKLTNRTKDKTVNLVVARPGRMLKVVTNGQIEGEANGYVKADDEDVIAHTGLIKPGETAEVTFDAPPAGEYQYFSTWPGYYTIMNGKLTIR
jgi:azurin